MVRRGEARRTEAKAAAAATATATATPPLLVPTINDWLLLGVAIALEVSGTTFMKLVSNEQAVVLARCYYAAIAVCYAASFAIFIQCLKRFPMSMAYAVWSGAGTALTAVVGFAFFSEALGVGKVVSVGLIVAGVVGLHFFG